MYQIDTVKKEQNIVQRIGENEKGKTILFTNLWQGFGIFSFDAGIWPMENYYPKMDASLLLKYTVIIAYFFH